MITDDKEKAEMINSYFCSVFSQRIEYNAPNKCEVQVAGTGWQLEIDKQIVKVYLTTLDEFRSPGPD